MVELFFPVLIHGQGNAEACKAEKSGVLFVDITCFPSKGFRLAIE